MANYVDYPHTGQKDIQGNLVVLKDQKALENAIILWLVSFRGERLYRPCKGGYVVSNLMKPMSATRNQNMERDIKLGLATDFKPPIKVEHCTVEPDLENGIYFVEVQGYCPLFKTAIYVKTKLKCLV